VFLSLRKNHDTLYGLGPGKVGRKRSVIDAKQVASKFNADDELSAAIESELEKNHKEDLY
jgi:hypothetical protein